MRVSWNKECEQAFKNLKDCLCSDPVLQSPNFNKQFILQTDASNHGVGAVLSQCDEEGQEHPVAYYSRRLYPREEMYSTIEKECLAIKDHFISEHISIQSGDGSSSSCMDGPSVEH